MRDNFILNRIPQYRKPLYRQHMFGKVKKFLGIEGVKLELLLPDVISVRAGEVHGKLRFQSMNPQTVTAIKVALVERYSRGRGKEKLVDEYELGSINQKKNIKVIADEPIEIDFTLPFSMIKSEMDQFQDKNFVYSGVAAAAKYFNGVKSIYRIEAEANVKGVALSPFDKKVVKLK